tara:strand:+ start:734 stop:1096 length:363 start_codon:yes stop_codon:yes gene_type:complete
MKDNISSRFSQLGGGGEIKIIKECPTCGKGYPEAAINIIEDDSEAQLLHVTCEVCANAILVLIVVSDIGVSSVGMLTDLHVSDVVRFRQKTPLDEDDMLQFYSLLHSKKGEIIHYLAEKK